jgi:hypothetical protein
MRAYVAMIDWLFEQEREWWYYANKTKVNKQHRNNDNEPMTHVAQTLVPPFAQANLSPTTVRFFSTVLAIYLLDDCTIFHLHHHGSLSTAIESN